MTEYEYRRKILEGAVGVDPDEDVTVDLPDDAVGITLRAFSDDVWVRYLVPVDEEVATDGGRRSTTIVGDPQHPAETYSPDEDDDPDAPAPMPDGGIPEYTAGDRFEFTAMGFQFEIAEVRETEIELADGDVVERDEFDTDLAENRVEIVDEEGDA